VYDGTWTEIPMGEVEVAVPAASSTLARAVTNYLPGCLMSLLIKPVLNPLVN